MTAILGVDIAKASFQVVLLREGQPPVEGQFSNDPKGFKQLWQFLKKRHALPIQVCLEATGPYGEALAEFAYQAGATVSVVNPAQIKAYGQAQLRRNKTDQLDAQLIADFCRTQQPEAWTPPDPASRELQALVRHLADLESDWQRQRNRWQALEQSARPSDTIRQQLQQHLDLLTQQIAEVKQAMQDHIDRHPDLKNKRDLLDSIPGIAPLTAAKLLGEIIRLDDFTDVRQLVAFAGLNPKHHQSGTSVHGHTHISKIGHSSIRAALYMPAVVAKKANPLLKLLAERLAQRGLSKMEIVVAVMRKLLHYVFGVLKSGQPFDPHFLDHRTAAP